jgi:F0F1-type ATP synthase membrane subunit b/b'
MLTLVSNVAPIRMLPNWTLGVQLLVFLVAFGVLSKFIFKPMLRVIEMRSKVTHGADDEAVLVNSEASDLEEKRLKLLREALTSFQDERVHRISKSRIKSEKMIAETRQESQWFLETSDMFIEASEKSIVEDMADKSKALAEEIAASVTDARG